MDGLPRIHITRKTGAEAFVAGGRPIGKTLSDFWGWSTSDLVDNTARGGLAEFIVASGLGISTEDVRDAWASWDLTTPDNVKVEVKSAAYLQSWWQKGLSKISFLTPKTLAWDPDTGTFATLAQRQAGVYVFALLKHTEKKTLNPLDLDQWEFYVLPTEVLNQRTRSQHSITLNTLQGLVAKGLALQVAFDELAMAVKKAAHEASL
jgi:hypothetical protein